MTGLRRIQGLWHRSGARVWYVPLALGLFGASLVYHSNGTDVGGLPNRPFDALAVVAIALQSLPLAGRRRWPVLCFALVSSGFALDQLRGYHTLAGIALPIGLISVAAQLERHRRTTAIALTAAYVPLAVALDAIGPGEPPSEYVMFYVAVALAWGVGTWLRTTRAAEAERRRRVAEDTRTAERARIARELHDVVTHHVTAMVVQAEAARYLTAAPDRLDQSLTAVTDTGRRAITDLRHLLNLLNPDHGTKATPPPVGRLLTLVEQTRRAGQPVEFTEEGTPAESTGSADLVAYRVVQESLTNALKYAHGSTTSVRVRHCDEEITVEVSTDSTGSKVPLTGGRGRGLAGLRERVDVLGGDFHAGRQPDGGFTVRVRIPARSPS
ncbi:sensor histidine kinase [Streptomyces sp. NPDC058378]|uniref:sensor histidine kinase n=1 Tax=Streptomyces sp. NPDC058378 TaxID=3346469 RepID=UPI00364B2FC8